MEKKYDVVALGEFLIDFTPAGSTDSGMKLFEQNPGHILFGNLAVGEYAHGSQQGRT